MWLKYLKLIIKIYLVYHFNWIANNEPTVKLSQIISHYYSLTLNKPVNLYINYFPLQKLNAFIMWHTDY